MAVPPSILNLANREGLTNLCSNVTGVLDTKVGSSGIEAHQCLWNPPISITTGGSSSSSIFPINYGLGGCGCGFGYGWSGGWNGGLNTFSEIIEDRNKVSFWDSFAAGFKEQLYVNPTGTLGTGANIIGSIFSALGSFGQAKA